MKKIAWLCFIFLLFNSTPLAAQINVGDNGKLTAKAYADYYWVASNHNSDLEGNNGFWFRRIYLTYNHRLSDSFSGRLRFEMNSEGDFESSSKLEPEVKDAWVKWANEHHSITAGISSTPTWGLVEDVWGYRSVEKSPLDLYDFGSSRDFGLSFKGDLAADGKLQYHFMFANGNSNRTEINKGKKFSLAISYYITEHLVIQGYGDWNDNPGNTDTFTAQGFLGYQSEAFNIGTLYAWQLRKNAEIAGDLSLDLISLFVNARVSKRVKIFARADHLFDPNPTGPGNDYIPFSDEAESTFMTAGVDIALDDKVHLLPNVESIVYGANDLGVRPATDLIPRLTISVSF